MTVSLSGSPHENHRNVELVSIKTRIRRLRSSCFGFTLPAQYRATNLRLTAVNCSTVVVPAAV